VINNGNNRELGDVGIIFRNCIPRGLVPVRVTGRGNSGYHCHGPDGHYPIQIENRFPSNFFFFIHGDPDLIVPLSRILVRENPGRQYGQTPESTKNPNNSTLRPSAIE
jgi:hypothetical protein